jgi:Na+/proline symporter
VNGTAHKQRLAAILAAAMSSSLSAIASTAVTDLSRIRDDRQALRLSRALVVVAGIAQIAVGVAMQQTTRGALSIALSIASLINGPILGVFFLGATKRADTRAALTGMIAGLVAVGAVSFGTSVAWPWYAVVGSLVTLAVGLIVPRRTAG